MCKMSFFPRCVQRSAVRPSLGMRHVPDLLLFASVILLSRQARFVFRRCDDVFVNSIISKCIANLGIVFAFSVSFAFFSLNFVVEVPESQGSESFCLSCVVFSWGMAEE